MYPSVFSESLWPVRADMMTDGLPLLNRGIEVLPAGCRYEPQSEALCFNWVEPRKLTFVPCGTEVFLLLSFPWAVPSGPETTRKEDLHDYD